MKSTLLFVAMISVFVACSDKKENVEKPSASSIVGTWALSSSKVIRKKDTLITFPVKNQEMIKMFTETHFTFMKHDTKQGKGDSTVFDAGAGTYELKGDDYSEHLQYCNYRDWENRDFHFKLRINGDTLIQTGIEKIDSLGIDQEILEVYVRKK
ncbi:hypothetical protein [Dyadobacter sp. CY326]|uniref:hypothetical protein n=1 Tax=Dyadobacter sp. CY326 TaxID=2907300 RepID=UPI001F46F71D|nr:hypothetical protein [Dyadobacter sp. CY326]MCE7066117.1 hypothetical protein [Dyadobacter sp. CY326]